MDRRRRHNTAQHRREQSGSQAKIRETLARIGYQATGGAPLEFGALIKSEVAYWGKVVSDVRDQGNALTPHAWKNLVMSNTHLLLNDRVRDYLLANEPPEHEELCKLRELTQKRPDARFQISAEQGHFLALLVRLMDAGRLLEIGTYTGYSTLAMALSLPTDGRLVTCDLNEETVSVGRPHWARAGVAERIEVIIGPALATLAELERSIACRFDLAFIDADKPTYDRYYEFALRLVRPGGLIVLDNMLRRGEVADLECSDPFTGIDPCVECEDCTG